MDRSGFFNGFSDVNGLKMYYEVYGYGKPLVLLHGGGSTIQSSFGNIIPYLEKNRKIIALELQAHGRTNDREASLSFKQDARDTAKLLENLGIDKADFLGFSNGGQTLFELALQFPEIINSLIICSAFYKKSAAVQEFWEGFGNASIDFMPQALQASFLKVNNDRHALLNMFKRDVERMMNFTGWSDEEISSITAPVLIMNSTQDVGSPEHAVEMYRRMPNAELVILPGKHGEYIGTFETLSENNWKQAYAVNIIEDFLDNYK